ncbi:MAG: hypothetical protein AAF567_03775 [Actinomycetota bacterium]
MTNLLSPLEPLVAAAPRLDASLPNTFDQRIAQVPFRSILISTVAIVTLVSFLVIGAATWATSGDPATALGVALACAFWGGPSFGAMAAAARVSSRLE